MTSSDNISSFAYFPFLKQLLTQGKVKWITPEKPGEEKLVTTLYIDGDLLCWILDDASGKPIDIAPEIIQEHFRKMARDMGSLNALATQIGMATAFIVAILTFAFNPSDWLENLLIISGISFVGWLTRRFTKPFVFKAAGKIFGVLLKRK